MVECAWIRNEILMRLATSLMFTLDGWNCEVVCPERDEKIISVGWDGGCESSYFVPTFHDFNYLRILDKWSNSVKVLSGGNY